MTFDETQQQSMLATFREHSRTCAIRDHREFKKWLEMKPGRETTGPFIDYIAREFVSLGSVQGWEVMVERSRNAVELTYSARIQPSLGKALLPVRNWKIELILPAIADARIARLVLFDTVRRSVLADTRPKPGTGTIQVRSVDGVPQPSSGGLELPIDLSVPRRIMLYATGMLKKPGVRPWIDRTLTRVYDSRGRLVASVPFVSR